MVDKAYLVEKPSPPSAAKLFFDQRAVPVLINAVGAVELELERIARTARAAPLASLAVALGVGCVVQALFTVNPRPGE